MLQIGSALAVSAALLCLTVARPEFWCLGWVALWPMFWLLETRPSWKRRLLLGALWLFLISQFGFPYAVSTAYAYLGHRNPAAAWMMGTTLGGVTSLRYLAFLGLAAQPRGRQRAWGWAALWCACELLIWQMMPVYGSVHVLGDGAFVQWAELLGAPGLSGLWFVLSLLLYDGFRGRRRLAPILGVFALVHLVGWVRLAQWSRRMQEWPERRVAVIQANQPPALQQTLEVGQAARQLMLERTQSLLHSSPVPPEVVVWPEASLPLVDYQKLGGLSLGVELVFTDYEPGRHLGYIVARLLDGDGQSRARYRKRKLIMMGEWLPWDRHHSFEVGQEDQLLPTALGPALPLVCFEGLWPGFVAGFHHRTGGAATWLVHMGSESSFSSPLACAQSLHLASLRAVELRRPMLRADNSGISGWIDVTGRIHQATPTFARESCVMTLAVDPTPSASGYTLWGDYLLYGLILIGLAVTYGPRPRASSD